MDSKTFVLVAMTIGIVYAGEATHTHTGNTNHAQEMPGFTPVNFPAFPVIDFNRFLGSYFQQMQEFHQQLANNQGAGVYSFTTQALNGNAAASSSLVYDNPSIKAMNDKIANDIGTGNSFAYSGGTGGGFGAGTNGAFAAGSFGPGGGYQTAAIYPENPDQPNIVRRFKNAEDAASNGKPYYYGVMSSSLSSSSNIDGKVTENRHAQTTVNDNGKITTYETKHP